MTPPAAPPTHSADAILAAVLPADARRVLLHPGVDSSLASTGREATADVEVLTDRTTQPSAPVAIVLVEPASAGLDSGQSGRMAIRVRDHLLARRRAGRAATRLQAAGYVDASTIGWDRIQVARVPTATGPARPLRRAEHLPRRSVVVARRAGSEPAPTVLEAAVAVALDEPWPWPLVRSGTLIVLAEALVVRVALGGGQHRLQRAEEVLRLVARSVPDPDVVPVVEAAGDAGLGAWTAERRLRGAPCPPVPPGPATADVLDVLTALQAAATEPVADVRLLAEPAIAALGGGPTSAGLRAAAEAVAADLEGLPACVVHGDFWHGNLLLHGDRLAGIIDWDSGSDGRLPFLDSLHLVIAGRVPKGSWRWGAEVARAIADEETPPLVRDYGEAIGVPVDRHLHRSLVIAYWLDRVAFQLGTYADRAARPRWLESNVDVVLRALDGDRR